MNEKLILDNIPLIYKVIKDMHCYWKTEDEFQSLYDAGLEGLIRGAKVYDPATSKPGTYLYTCIKNMIVREIQTSEYDCRKINKQTMVSLNKEVNGENDTTYEDFIEDPNINIEEEIEKKLEIERLLYAVNSLENKKDKLAIKMYYGLDGYKPMTMQEVSEKMNVSRNMINIRLKRCLPKLKKYLMKNDREVFMLEEKPKSEIKVIKQVENPAPVEKPSNTLIELNQILFKQLDKLNNATDDVDFEKEIRKSYAVSQLAQQIVANTNTCIKALKVAKEQNIDDKQLNLIGIGNEK